MNLPRSLSPQRATKKAARTEHSEPAPSSSSSSHFAKVQFFHIDESSAGQRIDNYLIKICKGVPKSHIYRILRSGEVRINKGRVDQTYRLEMGDELRLPPIRIAEKQIDTHSVNAHIPQSEFPILFEDEHLLVIDKPAGVAVHGGSGVSFGVIEQLRAARAQAKFLELVHRLDRETSGVLLIAKKRTALNALHEQMREGETDKRYLTLVKGDWKNQRQHIKLPLHKFTTPDGERRVRVQEGGQASHTVFTLLRKYDDFALLEAELKTGRTHQIRVHLSASGFPIVGDEKYGDFALNKQLARTDAHARLMFKRMFLHAFRISFTHPATGEKLRLQANLPKDCEQFLESLERI